jgi:hypothetical protein
VFIGRTLNIGKDLRCHTLSHFPCIIMLFYATDMMETCCDVFTPFKNCNIKTRSSDYATLDEEVFSPCQAELCRAVTSRASPRIAWPRLLPGNIYKHLHDARVERGHVTASAVTSSVSTVTQQLKHRWKERFPLVRSRVHRRNWSSLTSTCRWEIAVVLGRNRRSVASCEQSSWEDFKCVVKTLCVL